MKRRILSIMTALALVLGLCPAWAFAADADPSLCKHHLEHIGCGYIASPDGAPCGYECRICPIEALIDALPDKVTEDNRADVEAQLQKILSLFSGLTEEEQEQIDISRCRELQWQLEEAGVPERMADDVVQVSGDITINSSHNGKTLTSNGKTKNGSIIVSGITVSLTISDLNLEGTSRSAIVLENGANLTLNLQGANNLAGGGTAAGIKVPAGCTLTITGGTDASLRVLGGDGAAGIGASVYNGGSTGTVQTVGTIIINSGNITATGRGGGPGIGGTVLCTTGDVIINGGSITASGSSGVSFFGAAGIGAGYEGHLNSITITGGTVKATGMSRDGVSVGKAVGIGAGPYPLYVGNAPIGCGDISITGGTIRDTTIGFDVDDLANKMQSGSITIQKNVDLPGCSVKPMPQGWNSYTFNFKVFDTSITGGETPAQFVVRGRTYDVTIQRDASQPYCGAFLLKDVLLPVDGSDEVQLILNGKTLTKTVSFSSTTVNAEFGAQEHAYYSLDITIYDEKITGDMEAMVTIGGQTVTGQLNKSMEYCGTMKIEGIILPIDSGDGKQEVTVTAGGNTWTGTASAGRSKTLTIGSPIQPAQASFDLSYGDITFEGNGGAVMVTYHDGTGAKTYQLADLSKVYEVTQSNAGTATANRLIIQNMSEPVHIRIKDINIATETNSPIDITNGKAILETSGTNTVTASGETFAGVHVGSGSELTLAGTGQLTAKSTHSTYSGAGIGSDKGKASGKIVIQSGTVIAESAMYGAGIGSGRSGSGTVTINGGTVTATGGSSSDGLGGGAGIGGGSGGFGTVTINGGTVTATGTGGGNGIGGGSSAGANVTISGGTVYAKSGDRGSGIGGSGQSSRIDIHISGGIITADATGSEHGSGIGSGTSGTATIKISGGTIKASAHTSSFNKNSGIGSGHNGSATVTITGGTIQASGRKSAVENPKDENSTVLSLVTITLDGVGNDVPVTGVSGVGSYGCKDVYTRDGGKLYFYLPNDERPTITAGGVDYVPDSEGSTNYVVDFRVSFNGYALTKQYDGTPMQKPTTDQVTSNGEDLTFAWYQDETPITAPVNAGSYTLRVSSDKGSKDFEVTITKRPLTITASAQTIDYGGSIAQDAYTSGGLAAGDTLEVTLEMSKTAAGTHAGAITVSAQITRDGANVAGNYEITYTPGDLTINKIAPTVDSWPTAGAITYGQTLSNSMLIGDDTSGTFSWADGTVKPGAGNHSYTVVFTPTNPNYDTVSGNISVTVNKAQLTITAKDQTIAYGGSIQTDVGQVTASGLVNDDTLTAVQVSVSDAAGNVGTYTDGITVTSAKIGNNGTNVTANYAISYAAGDLTIDKATLTVSGATIKPKSYDTTKTATVSGVTFTGLVNGETLALGTDYSAIGIFANADAGTSKDVTVTVTLTDTAKANNYTLASSSVDTIGTITKADPVVTEVSVSSPDPIYESAALGSITLTHGAGDTAGTVALDAGQTLTVGTKGYAWTFTPTDTNNYNTATGTISLTVAVDALQSIAVTTQPTKTAYTYGESFDKAGMVITATYASGATKVVTDEVIISPATLEVATSALTITYQGKTATQAITVSPKTVSAPTIELSPSSFVYDGTEKKPAVTVKDGEKMIPADEYTVEYSNNTNVGTTATVTITDKTGGNYTVSGAKTFTITAKPLTGASVSVTGPFTYTGSALTPEPTVTLDGKPLVKDTDYTVDYADNTNAGTATITITGTGNYSGTAQGTFTIGKATLTVDGTGTASGTYGAKLSDLTVDGLTAKLGEAQVTGTWKLAGDAVPNVGDSGEYTATFTPTTGAGNYLPLTAKVTLNIAQAVYSGTKTASTSAKLGATGTYDLSALLPAGYTLGTPVKTDTNSIFDGEPTVDGTTLTYKLAANAAVGNSGTITVPVTSANYIDFNLTITVKVTDKDVPTLTVGPITVTYTGEAVPGTAIKGTAKVGSTTVPGTWAFASGEAVTNVADSGTKTVKFVPTDGTNYAEATATVVVTINKATPTGAPKYTAISTSGKTLADAGLTTEGSTLKPAGTVAWMLDNTTEVTANTQYEWMFTPTDTANYTTLTGKITLWPYTTPVNPGGGGGYVPSIPGGTSLPVTTTGQGSTTTTTTTTATPTASVSNGTATTTINTAMGNEIVKQAVANNSETVVIAPSVTGSVTKAEVSIPASTVGQIGSRTNASLTVSTPVADVTIPNGGLGSLSSVGGTVTVTAQQTDNSVELSVTAGGRTVQNVPGGVTLTVPVANTTPGTVAVLVHEDGTREVVRKSVADNGAVTIPLDGSAKLEIVDNSGYFADVPATSWEADAVAFASSHELFNGTAPGQFSPNTPMSRGMLAVVLHNLESNPAQALTGAFTDVDNSQWYAEGVAWAQAQGIIGGYGNGRFGPNDNITREQLAVMLWRYAGSPAATDRELHFADAHRASDWALEALRWTTENGIINGKGGGILDPTGQATRAETAQMLKNFTEKL